MTEIAQLGFVVNTSGLVRGEQAMGKYASSGRAAEKSIVSSFDRIEKELVDSLSKVKKELNDVSSSFGVKTPKAIKNLSSETKAMNKALAASSRSLGQAGIQVQQFIGQIQGGQSFMVAFSQQSADLGIVLGAPLAGAIAGIVTSLGGIFLPTLFKTTNAITELEKVSKELANTFDSTADSTDILTDKLVKLGRKSEALARLQISTAILEAEKQIKIAGKGIEDALESAFGFTTETTLKKFSASFDRAAVITGKSIDDISESVAKGSALLLPFADGAGIVDTARILSDQFKISREQAVELGLAISRAFSDQSAFSIKGLENTLSDLNAETGGTSEKLVKLASSILPLSQALSDGVDITNKLRIAFGDIDRALDDSDKKVLKSKNTIENLSKSLQGQIIALKEGEQAALEFSIKNKLLADEIKEIPEAIQNQIDAIFRLRNASDNSNIALERQVEAIKNSSKQLALGADAYELYIAKMKLLAAGAAPEVVKAMLDIIKKNQELAKSAKNMQDLTNQVDSYGGSWSKTGSIIIDTFGDISDSIGDYMSQLEELDGQQEKINKARMVEGADQVALNKLQKDVNENRVSAELDGLSALSKAGASLFEEKTAAAKAFSALNKIITVAEIALSFQKMTVGTTEAGVHVANETVKAEANSLTAITSAFAAPFPINFVAGAAMIGIMASLIGSVAGGGSGVTDPTEARQASQGPGTVFGSDEASQSIINSQERFVDINIDQLAELKDINRSMSNLSLGISQLARSFASGGIGSFQGATGTVQDSTSQSALFTAVGTGIGAAAGGPIGAAVGATIGSIVGGLFGKTSKKVIDEGVIFVEQSLGQIFEAGFVQAEAFFDIETTKKKLFGLSKSSSLSTETQDISQAILQEMGDIFGSIGDTIVSSAKLLGFDTVTLIMEDIQRNDLFSDRFSNEVGSHFTSTFSEVELSLEAALATFRINIGKVSSEGLTGEEFEKELQEVFSKQADLIAEFLVPGIEEFSKLGEGLFDTLTRVTFEQSVFNDNIEQMGFNLSELSSIMKINVAQSLIDLTGGFERFSELSSSFVDDFFSESEKFAFLQGSLSDVFSSLELPLVTTREEFRNLVDSVDITTDSGQQLLATLLQVSPAMSEFIDGLEDVEQAAINASNALKDDAINAFGTLEESIDLERQRLKAILDVAAAAHNAEIERIELLRAALNEENEIRKQNLLDAETTLNTAFNNEITRIQEVANARIQSLNEERSAIEATASSMQSLISKINGAIGVNAGANLIEALSTAMRGDFSQAQNLNVSSLSSLSSSGFSSASELAFQQAVNRNMLQEISMLAGEQLSDAEKQIDAIDRQIKLTQSIADAEIESLNDQLNTLLGIDEGVLNLNTAIADFQTAQADLDALNFEVEVEKLDMLISSAEDVFRLHEDNYREEQIRLDSIISVSESLLNSSLGINDTVATIPVALDLLQLAINQIPIAIKDSSTSEAETQSLKDELVKLREENALVLDTIASNTGTSAAVSKQGQRDFINVRDV